MTPKALQTLDSLGKHVHQASEYYVHNQDAKIDSEVISALKCVFHILKEQSDREEEALSEYTKDLKEHRDSLIHQLDVFEEENKSLRNTIMEKEKEIQHLKNQIAKRKK